MLTKQTDTDKFGGTIIKYQLTQGDTFPMTLSLKDDEGTVIPQLMIERVWFTLGTDDRELVFSQDFEPIENEKFKLLISSEETMKWEADTKYFFEIKVKFTDDFLTTPPSYKSTLLVLPTNK